MVITGGSQGLGRSAAIRFAELGWSVVLSSRSIQRAQSVSAAIRRQVPGARVSGWSLDLSSMPSVRSSAEILLDAAPRIDVLINNAGSPPPQRWTATGDGNEVTMATDHLGHFLLTSLLMPRLIETAQRIGQARVVVVSSRLHKVPFSSTAADLVDDPNLDDTRYRPLLAYRNAKLANVLFAYELDRRVRAAGVRADALCPGFVPLTIASDAVGMQASIYRNVFSRLPFAHTVDEAVDTYVHVATQPSGTGGGFYAESSQARSSRASYRRNLAESLWRTSETLTDLRFNKG